MVLTCSCLLWAIAVCHRLCAPLACTSFDNIVDTFVPTTDGSGDKCYISESYDPSSHFETTRVDILSLYARVTGEPLNMDISSEIPKD